MNYELINYIHWNVNPEILPLGGLSLRWYGLLFATGFLVGQQLMIRIYKWEGLSEKEVDRLTIWVVVATVIGARLGHCIFYEPYYYFSNPLKIFAVWEGGLASHGGAIGILTSLYIYSKKNPNQPYLWLLDRAVIPVAFSGFCIRFGNLMNSEIIGKETDLPWAFIFERIDTVPRHPAQLYESLSTLLLFLFLWTYYKKYKANLPEGRLFGIFITILFSLRFCYEFLKENQVNFEEEMSLNMGQLLSLPMIAVGIYLWKRSIKTGPTKR